MEIIKATKKFMTMDKNERMDIVYFIILSIMLTVLVIMSVRAFSVLASLFLENPIRCYLLAYGLTILMIVILIWGGILEFSLHEIPVIWNYKIKYYVFIGFGIIIWMVAQGISVIILEYFDLFDFMARVLIAFIVGLVTYVVFWRFHIRPLDKEILKIRLARAEHIKLKWR